MPHFITTHSINNPNYIKMQQNKNQQLDAKFRKFIKVLIMALIYEDVVDAHLSSMMIVSRFMAFLFRWCNLQIPRRRSILRQGSPCPD